MYYIFGGLLWFRLSLHIATNINNTQIVQLVNNSPTLINQLDNSQVHQNNLIVYNIPETELVNQQDIKTDLLFKFKELTTGKSNVTIETKDIVSIYCLGSKMDTNPKYRPILVKFVSTSLKLKLIKNAFHLKNTSYSISIDIGFNFATINWDNLLTTHQSNHCTSEFHATKRDGI